MLEYISREAARPDTFCEGVSCQDCPFCKDLVQGGCRIDDFVKSISAADVVEVTHAEWVAENSRPKSGLFYCSNCHRTCYDPQPTRAKGWTKRCRYHYCPNCGAKMDGGQDDGE